MKKPTCLYLSNRPLEGTANYWCAVQQKYVQPSKCGPGLCLKFKAVASSKTLCSGCAKAHSCFALDQTICLQFEPIPELFP